MLCSDWPMFWITVLSLFVHVYFVLHANCLILVSMVSRLSISCNCVLLVYLSAPVILRASLFCMLFLVVFFFYFCVRSDELSMGYRVRRVLLALLFMFMMWFLKDSFFYLG